MAHCALPSGSLKAVRPLVGVISIGTIACTGGDMSYKKVVEGGVPCDVPCCWPPDK